MIGFPKPRRRKDDELRRLVSRKPCIICGTWPSDPDHITTRGAGGEDEPDNVWNLCRAHHAERHQIGLLTFIGKYHQAATWLHQHARVDVLFRMNTAV